MKIAYCRTIYLLIAGLFVVSSLHAADNSPTLFEYFFDTDPGFGQGQLIQTTEEPSHNINLDISNLSPGLHKLFVRAQHSDGNWGMTQGKPFYIQPDQENVSTEVTQAEYYIDNDPGFGNGNALTINQTNTTVSSDIDISGLDKGIHRFFVRTKNSNDTWGLSQARVFYIPFAPDEPQQNNLTQIEYFFDNDSGTGNGLSLNPPPDSEAQAYELNLANLQKGLHQLHIRAFNGIRWGLVQSRPVFIPYDNDTVVPPMEKIEYFFDTDDGFGNGTVVNVTDPVNTEKLMTIDHLEPGLHRLYVRSSNNEKWGPVQSRPVYIAHTEPENQTTIQSIEYFFDAQDPGFGHATPISLSTTEPILTINHDIFLWNTLATGDHTFHVRAQNDNALWSNIQSASFYYEAVEIEACILSVLPLNQNVSASAGNTSIDIENKGAGVLKWTSEIIEGNSWISMSNVSGQGNSTINISYQANTTFEERTGKIQVNAENAGNSSPQVIEIIQSARQEEMMISPIENLSAAEDEMSEICFTVSYTGNSTLTVTADSSNKLLVQNDNMIITNVTGICNYKIAIQPEPDRNGSTTITLTARNDNIVATESFTLEVTPVNDSPLITCPNNQLFFVNHPVVYLAYATVDVDENDILNVNAQSSNQTLFSNDQLIISDTSIAIHPETDQYGQAVIRLQVSDGNLDASCSFTVEVEEQSDCYFEEIKGNPIDPIWTMYIESATLDGANLQSGDIIYIYDGDTMVGSFALTQEIDPPVYTRDVLIAWSTLNTGIGYQSGNQYKLVCCSQGKMYENFEMTLDETDVEAYHGQVFPEGLEPYSIVSIKFFSETSEQSFVFHLEQGWNLVSFPLIPQDNSVQSLFSDSQAAFEYTNGGYIRVTNIVSEKGYWIKVPNKADYEMKGQPFQPKTISLSEGWHLIGASKDETIPSIDFDKKIIVIYKYINGSYVIADKLEPGLGYWIKISDTF